MMTDADINQFYNVKNIFVEGKTFDYINLDKSVVAYDKLSNAIGKPLKLVLFYGKPGSGKTFLLEKIYNDLRGKYPIVFFPRPFFDEKQFLKSLFEEVFAVKSPEFSGYEEFLKIYQTKIPKTSEQIVVTVLLDEAQLYPNDLIEKIRLMADTRLFKFLFTVHKTEKEDVLAKDYFKTRIWESVELGDSSFEEIRTYLEKKFIYHNKFEYFSYIKDYIPLIFSMINGNLRSANKLLFKVFELYEYYEANKPSIVTDTNSRKKIIEMAAIATGLINA
ncbi:MAG: ATP-binding protein [Campylobacteraceae bacterium]|jgi:4-hydroxy-tetrahydrodipicolinate synthase|nr:ATP-binding protein [Campylobacteraceae bacterium]